MGQTYRQSKFKVDLSHSVKIEELRSSILEVCISAHEERINFITGNRGMSLMREKRSFSLSRSRRLLLFLLTGADIPPTV